MVKLNFTCFIFTLKNTATPKFKVTLKAFFVFPLDIATLDDI